MRLLAMAAVTVALAGCDKLPKAGAPEGAAAAASSEFPKAGEYHVVHDIVQGSETKREESDQSLDVSDRGKFADQLAHDDGTNCRDKQVTIRDGSFSVHMVCDAPDGDIHNIGLDRRGTYSADSIDVTTETTLWGMPFRESHSYRLKDSGQ